MAFLATHMGVLMIATPFRSLLSNASLPLLFSLPGSSPMICIGRQTREVLTESRPLPQQVYIAFAAWMWGADSGSRASPSSMSVLVVLAGLEA